jgi:hypothetical protein
MIASEVFKKGQKTFYPFNITSSAAGFIPGRLLLSRARFRLKPAKQNYKIEQIRTTIKSS